MREQTTMTEPQAATSPQPSSHTILTEAQNKARALGIIRQLYPTAVRFGVSSDDQGHSGYLLTEVNFADNSAITYESGAFFGAADEVDDYLRLLPWGAFGDADKDAAFEVDLATGQIIR